MLLFIFQLTFFIKESEILMFYRTWILKNKTLFVKNKDRFNDLNIPKVLIAQTILQIINKTR